MPGGSRAGSLAEAMITDGTLVERHLGRHASWERNVFAALGTAFFQDGAFVHVADDAQAPAPIELVFLAATPGVVTHPRALIVAGRHGRLTVIERYVALTAGACFANAVTEIVAGPGASVDHHVVQEQDLAAFHVATLQATLERDASLSTSGFAFGGRLARTTLGLSWTARRARSSTAASSCGRTRRRRTPTRRTSTCCCPTGSRWTASRSSRSSRTT
jgi:Fe-S cluster assembly protein SufD